MALYTEQEISREIWSDREFILSKTHPEDSAHEYADGAVPIYYSDIVDTWQELPDEYSNSFHEVTDTLPDRIEDLMKVDIYLYYQMLYSGAIQNLIDGDTFDGETWTETEEQD
jgi:hypothetical protein